MLIVDDNADAADMLCNLFAALGYVARCAYNGEDGVHEAARFAPHVIVMDLAMPGMDGLEVLRRMKGKGLFRISRTMMNAGYS